MAQENTSQGKTPQPRKPALARRIFRVIGKTLKYFLLLLLLLAAISVGVLYWATQTEKGLQWLETTLNSLLAQPPGSDQLSFAISSLKGSIPAQFSFALEARDKNGLWLTAPDNSFAWDWRALPQKIHFTRIQAANVDVVRLPEIPPSTEPPKPSEPLTIPKVQEYLRMGASFLAKKHWWLPELAIDEISLAAILPPGLLPAQKTQRLAASSTLSARFADNRLKADARAALASSDQKPLALPSCSLESLNMNLALSGAPIADGIELKLDMEGAAEKPVLAIDAVPADFLGPAPRLSLNLTASANTGQDAESASINIAGPSLDAGHIQMSAGGGWQTDQKWRKGEFGGPLDYKLNLELLPLTDAASSPLAAIASPARLGLNVNGDLPLLNLLLALDCDKIKRGEHVVTGTSLSLTARDVDLPLNADAIHALEKENRVELRLATKVDGHPGRISSEIFFQQLEGSGAAPAGWRVGLRDLAIDALGARGTGQLAALLPDARPPAIDGQLRLELSDWTDINKLLPGQNFSGDARIDALLQSGGGAMLTDAAKPLASPAFPANASFSQSIKANIAIPAFSMGEKNSRIALKNLKSDIFLSDVFNTPAVNLGLNADKITAAGMSLSAHIKAEGSLKGPLKAEAATKGSVNSRIAAQWEPGKAQISTLEVLCDLAPFLGQGGKKKLAGIKSAGPATVSYGDNGIKIDNLDLRLTPAGHLRASGGMSPEKLNLAATLDDLNFKPWQSIVPQLPAGSASFHASLSGTPARPAGNFRLGLQNIALPNNPLPPVSLALAGTIEHAAQGSALKAKLEIDPQTVKTLGGTVAEISATVPLLFGADGVPKPDMTGPLRAIVRWDGALGPIWNLLPIPDRRLNGRIAVNMSAAGSMQKPRINGIAEITQARFEDLLLGILLTDINLKLELDDTGRPGAVKGPLDNLPGSMKLALNISDGRGGSVTANGGGALDGSSINIQTKIDRLKPLRRRDVQIELSGNAAVSGSATAPLISGEIIVDKGEVLLNNLEITGSVTTLDISDPATEAQKEPPKPKTEESGERGSLNVRVRMLPRFAVEGRGLASIWKADLLVQGALDDPKITGNISCVRGNFDFLGKIFTLTKGIVFFGGGSLSNPLIDIDLTHETDDLTAHILVSGPVNKIRVKLTSDPVVPRDEILSRVLFGRSVNDLSRMEMLQLAGAVAQLAGFGGGSSILSSAKKALGVDVLRIGTADTGADNQSNEDTGGGTTIEMGKYINDYIYMGVQQGMEPDSTAFILELELSPRSSLEIRSEQEDTWGGIKWKMNY